MSFEDKEGLEVFQDFERNSKDRFNWETHWKEIAERFIPSHSNQFNTFSQNLQSKGQKRTEEIYDSTPSIALGRFSSILDSLLTPKNQTWQRLQADNAELNKIRRVAIWFEEATRLLFKYRYAPRANFASQNNQVWKSIGGYGTGGLFIDDAIDGPGMRYKSIHLSQLFIVENHQGIVDKVFRYFSMTAKQAADKWGPNLPECIKNKLDTAPTHEFFFIHRVQPNKNQNPQRLDAEGMAFESVYISVEGKKVLEKGGYNSWPYPISRYEIAPGETYGRSPAMEVLPAVKTLNEQKKTVLKQGHRTVDPVILAHDDGILDTFSLKPGAINGGGVSADGRPLVSTLPVGNIAIGKDLMDDERAVVNDAFFITLFQILMESPQMTATEVLERVREKGMLLSPTIGRQESEYLGQVTERELDILMRQGALPQIPPELVEAQGEYKIVYDSPLARAARAEEAAGLMRTVETAMGVATNMQDPSLMDHFDWDTIIPEISSIQGVPVKWMRSLEKVQEIRTSRAEAAQAQEDIQSAPGEAALMKAANEVEKTA